MLSAPERLKVHAEWTQGVFARVCAVESAFALLPCIYNSSELG